MGDRVLRNELRRTNDWLRQLGPQLGRIPVLPQGTSPATSGTYDHGLLSGLDDDDHLQYLLLEGRLGGQTAHGSRRSGVAGSMADDATLTAQKEGTGGVTWAGVALDVSAQVTDIVVVVLCTAGRDGSPTQTHDSITDTQGHTWTRHAYASFERPAALNRFAAASIWTTVVTTQLTAGVDTLSVTFSGAVGSRAMEARTFAGFTGATVSSAGSTSQGVDVNSPADPPASLTLSGLASKQYLFVRATSVADNNTSYTPSSGYSEFTGLHTGSTTAHGTIDDNVGARGEFQLTIGTASTSAGPTINLSNLPMTLSLMVALQVAGGTPGILNLFSGDDADAAEIQMTGSTINSNFDFFNFRSIGSTTTLSYIRGSDGAFVGPIVPTPALEHSSLGDRTGFTVASCVTNATTTLTSSAGFGSVQAGHMIFGATISAGTTVSVVTDASTLTMSQVAAGSGTQTLTFASDDHSQYLALYGRGTGSSTSNGQHIGTSPAPGGLKTAADLSLSGRLNIGTSNFVADTSLQVAKNITSVAATVNFARLTPAITASGTSNSNYRGLLVQLTNGASISSGSPSFTGATYGVSPALAVTAGTLSGMEQTVSFSGAGAAVGTMYGQNATVSGNTSYFGNANDVSTFTGIRTTLNPNLSNVATLNAIELQTAANSIGGVTVSGRGINFETLFATGDYTTQTLAGTVTNGSATITAISGGTVRNGMLVSGGGVPALTYVTAVNTGASTVSMSNNGTAGGTGSVTFAGAITNLSMLYKSSTMPSNVQTMRLIDFQGDDISQHFGRVYLRPPTPSAYPVPTAYLHIGAGAAAASSAPLKLTSGTSLTTAEAGAVEFTTDDFFLTITTGAARKGIVLNDGTNLTSGRVPFATTNGRLVDDADMTFATDTLTITKIAATTFSAGFTMADAQDVVLNATTGTKIGTANTQKLGFWNAAPVVQPATGGAAATFVTNTSLIANDSATFDGYTLGQVVKALRNIGVLA